MGTFKSYKEQSRIDWGNNYRDDEKPNRDDLKFGALLRIADATEAMAKRHTELIDENVRLREALKSLEFHYTHEKNSNRTLRGQITKLRKKLNK